MTIWEYRKPALNLKQVHQLPGKYFGLKTEELKLLPGDRSQNFLVIDESNKKYVLKVSSAFDRTEELDFENQVMILLKRYLPQYEFPQPLSTIEGRLVAECQINGQNYYLRLLEYVEGYYLSDLKSIPEKLWRETGTLLGKIDLVLQDFFHPGSRRFLPWDVQNLLVSRDRLKYVSEPELRRQLDYCLLQFETLVLPNLSILRRQVIYGDGNEHNFILEKRGPETRLKGLIDFGDMTESYLVAEPAVALTYALMKSDQPELTARQLLASYSRINSLRNEELDVLFYLILARLVISLTMAAWRREVEPGNKYMRISENPARRLLTCLLSQNPEKWRRLFYRACGFQPDSLFLQKEKLLAFRKTHFSPALSLTYRRPLHIVKGAGQYLFDSQGRTYLDCVNNVCHIGHCHPRVVRAVTRQMAALNTNTRYLYDQMALYVEKLLSKFPRRLNFCFLVNSGSEANDLALRLARNYTGGTEILVIEGAYHGNLTSLIEVSPYKFNGPGGKGAPPFVHQLPTPDPYRGIYRGRSEKTSEKYAALAAEIIDRLLSENKKLVGILAETAMGCAGQVFLPPEFLKKVYALVRKAGGLCIADEVQVGFGRLGHHFWGFESQSALPDIVTLGKPIGNGHPIGAVITTEEIARAFATGMEYFNTFGGNPVSCAAGLAVLEAIEEEKLQENAKEVGNHFLQELRKLQKNQPLIGEVRGSGLFIGVELVQDRQTKIPASKEAALVIEKMKTQGILVSTDGPARNVLKIKPPLVFTRENADLFVEKLAEVLKALK